MLKPRNAPGAGAAQHETWGHAIDISAVTDPSERPRSRRSTVPPPAQMRHPVVQFIYFDAGGGHRSAALALRQVIAHHYPTWQVELVNLQELLRSIDPVLRLTQRRVTSESVYNGMLKRGWTYGSLPLLRGLQAGIRLRAPQIEALLEAHWRTGRPDLVVSLIPNFNGVLFRSLRRIHASTPYVTIMTDLADQPPRFWQEDQDQFIICGSDRAVAQARGRCYRPGHIMQVSGMVLHPRFYEPCTADRTQERRRHGLDPALPTALIMFGGHGSKRALGIVDHLARLPFPVQSIVMCGHNQVLARQLAHTKRCLAVGFTDRVPYYMRLADFFIGKPGPGSVSEALHIGLPVIIERNRRTMPQERYNAEWIAQHEVGLVLKDLRQIGAAVTTMLTDDRLQTLRDNTKKLRNQALFEIPDQLDRVMRHGAAAPLDL